jgi:hypothetical protein
MENQLIPNSTQIPNIISDLICPRIPEGEMRCLNYICRRTYGFNKERDRISLSQFVGGIKDRDGQILDYGTGLSRPTVVEALKNLVGSRLVEMIPYKIGNSFKINLELFRCKEAREVADEVVKKINQLRHKPKNESKQPKLFPVVKKVNHPSQLSSLTNIGKESKPQVVKKLNPQNPVETQETQSLAAQAPRSDQDIFEILDAFKVVNDSFMKYFGNTTQRAAAARMAKIHGKEKVIQVISTLDISNKQKFCPHIYTACQLEDKWNKLQDSFANIKSEEKKPFYKGMPMRQFDGRWKVLCQGEWKEYADKESLIEFK